MTGGRSDGSSKAPTTPMPAATSPPYRRTWPALSRRSWWRTTTMSVRGNRSSGSTIAIFVRLSTARRRSLGSGRQRSPVSRRESCCSRRPSARQRRTSTAGRPRRPSPGKTTCAIANWRNPAREPAKRGKGVGAGPNGSVRRRLVCGRPGRRKAAARRLGRGNRRSSGRRHPGEGGSSGRHPQSRLHGNPLADRRLRRQSRRRGRRLRLRRRLSPHRHPGA